MKLLSIIVGLCAIAGGGASAYFAKLSIAAIVATFAVSLVAFTMSTAMIRAHGACRPVSVLTLLVPGLFGAFQGKGGALTSALMLLGVAMLSLPMILASTDNKS